MFFGIGVIFGVIVGAIIGTIVDSATPQASQAIMVCQDCGYVSQPINQTNLGTPHHRLFCSSEDSNLDVVRNDLVKGTIIIVRIKIDNDAPFDIVDNSTTCLKLNDGVHVF